MQGQTNLPYAYTPTTSSVRPGFASRTAKVLGVAQVLLGVLSIIFQVISIFVEAGMFYVGAGIWTAVFMIIAGAFGIVCSSYKTSCMIVTFMVMSILAATFAGIGMALACGSIAIDQDPYNYYYRYHGASKAGRVTLDVLLVIVALIEMIAAIWSSVICCKATCCLPGMDDYNRPYHVQYIPAGGPQPMVLLAPQGGVQGGVVYAIPQAAGTQCIYTGNMGTNAAVPPSGNNCPTPNEPQGYTPPAPVEAR